MMPAKNIRLSRITHPRASMWAIALLVVVFVGFGVLAEATDLSEMVNESSAQSNWLAQIGAVIHG